MDNRFPPRKPPTHQLLQQLTETATINQNQATQQHLNEIQDQKSEIGSQNKKKQESLNYRKKPKRNLTAYNFFFREERQKIIELGLEEYNRTFYDKKKSKSCKKSKRDDNKNVLSELKIPPKDSDTYQVCSKNSLDQKLRATIRSQGSCQIGSVSRTILGSILREEENPSTLSSSISDQRLSATKSQETSRRESVTSNDVDSRDSSIREEYKPLKSTSSIQRKRKKSPHYKVSFEVLGKVIAKRWKEVSTEDLDRYKNLAETDLKRYNREKEAFHKVEESERLLQDLQYAPYSQTAHTEAACITDEATLLQQQQESTQHSLDIIVPTSFSPVNHSLNNSLELLNSVLPSSSSALLNQIRRSSTIPLEAFRSSILSNLHRLSLQPPLFSSPSHTPSFLGPLIVSPLSGNIEAQQDRSRQQMHSSNALNIDFIGSQFLASPLMIGGVGRHSVDLPFRGHVATSGIPFTSLMGERLYHGTQLNGSSMSSVPFLNSRQSEAVPMAHEMIESFSSQLSNQDLTTTYTIDPTNHSLSAETTMNPPDSH